MRRGIWLWLIVGCGGPSDFGEAGPAALERATPVYGGTMAANESLTVVADPVRDLLLFAPSRSSVFDFETHTVQLDEGAEPFRVVLHDRIAYVTLRGSGQVVAFDRRSQEEVARVDVCDHPRGIAVDDGNAYVACAGGALVALEPETLEVRARYLLQPDLRDVVIDGSTILVSRFRAAEVLRVSPDTGEIQETLRPSLARTDRSGELARVAWRMISRPDGGAVLLHQAHQATPLGGDGSFQTTAVYYSPQIPVTTSHISVITSASQVVTSAAIREVHPAVDLAVDPTGTHFAVAGGLTSFVELWGAATFTISDDEPLSQLRGIRTSLETIQESAVTSVAIPEWGQVRTYHRGAGQLSSMSSAVSSPDWHQSRVAEENLFHLAPASGTSCVSCHPEGQDDGHTWEFEGRGARRTQNLAGGLRSRETFHWEAEFPTLDSLMSDVFSVGMEGREVSRAEVGALGAWLDAIPPVSATPHAGTATLERGAALFGDPTVGCTTCHSGPQLSDHQLHVVARGQAPTKTPSLLGVGTRAPFMHDGCAPTMLDRFTDEACGGDRHGDLRGLSQTDLEALAAFVNTL